MRQTWVIAIVAIAVLFVAGMPAVQAAAQKVKVQGKVGNIDAKRVPAMGLLDAPGSSGAVAVRNYAGGGGLLGTGDCTEAPDPRPNTLSIPADRNTIITGIIVTGTAANVAVAAPD